MNYYEHTYIASQSLNNKDLSDLHQKIEDLIKKNKGKIEKKENWSLRQLAYPIKNFKKGYYTNLYFFFSLFIIFFLYKFRIFLRYFFYFNSHEPQNICINSFNLF